jgi:hypothetical protein
MVGGWNPLILSLISLAEGLEKLGLVYHNSTVSYIEFQEANHA